MAFLSLSSSVCLAQGRHVPFNGRLLDVNGNAIKNARVYITSPHAYCPTDKNGNFGLTDVNAGDTLRILVKKRVYSVPVAGRRSLVIRLYNERDIQAEQDQQLIDIGYGHVRRRERTGAADSYISGQELQDIGVRNILEGLMGRVPGLVVTYVNGEPRATIRGTKSITGTSEPLFVLDGVVVPSLDIVNIFDVDYIEILKDAAIYGSRGANGAILVYTKK